MAKIKNANLTVKMLLLLLQGILVGSVAFIILYFGGSHVLMNYYYESDYIYKAETPYVKHLQKYVTENHVAATDFEKLKKWSNKQKISYFLVSRERKILFDNFYVEDNLLKPAENDMLNYTWYFLQNVKFEDGDADVYIYADYEVKIKLFFIFTITAISFGICFVVFIFGIRKEVKYIQKLSESIRQIDQMRKTLIKKEENEKKMNKNQNKLVLAMAHDLRTPLTSLITFLEIAIKKSANNENQEYIQKSYQKANQIRELTDQLFDFFLIQKQEKIELDPPANAEYVLGEYLSEFCAFVEAEGYQVIVKNMEWGEAKVQVYHRYIGRITDNLVSNIKKYADKDYPIILEMKNNENTIQIVFENQKNTKKEYVKGTGIGIQNIKNMIEQMKGESEIINNGNRYAIVLSFPIYRE